MMQLLVCPMSGEEGECSAKQKKQRTSRPEKKSLSGLLY